VVSKEGTKAQLGKPLRLPTTNVILIGHSVGAYILLEVLRRHLERRGKGCEDEGFRVVGGVLLFPTVVDIGKSPSGLRASVSNRHSFS
jgi:pimeloyl-ACP methyl ester carboxylesterase